jgi:mannonate dehydratase
MYAAMKAYYDIGYKGAIRPRPCTYNGTEKKNTRPGYMTIGTPICIGLYERTDGIYSENDKKHNYLTK